jgi:hypothetical protein
VSRRRKAERGAPTLAGGAGLRRHAGGVPERSEGHDSRAVRSPRSGHGGRAQARPGPCGPAAEAGPRPGRGPRCTKRGAEGNNPEAVRPEGNWLGGVQPRSHTLFCWNGRESAAGSLPLTTMRQAHIMQAFHGDKRHSEGERKFSRFSSPFSAAHGGRGRGEIRMRMEPVARGARHGRPPLRESGPTKGGAESAVGGWSRPTGTAGGWASRGRGAPPEARSRPLRG